MTTIILNGSPRKNGDTAKIIEMMAQKIKGNLKIFNTAFENFSPCTDCRFCHYQNKCSINDSITQILNEIALADNVVFASPLHYSMLSGSLLNFASRFQYFFVSKKIRNDENVCLKQKKGFLILTGGGATKDFAPIEKVSKLIFRQIEANFCGALKYIDTDKNPLSKFDYFSDDKKNELLSEIENFANLINSN